MNLFRSVRTKAFVAAWSLAACLFSGVVAADEDDKDRAVDDLRGSLRGPTLDRRSDPRQSDSFINTYCIECHRGDEAEGERALETFKLPITSVQQLITADEIIDQVTLKTMPPEDADQPTDDERLAIVKQLRDGIQRARDRFSSTGGRTVMRRLSNREYEVTLATLFNRRVDTLGLTADFPKDNTSQHVDTIGESLVTSGFLLDQYFLAASRLVEARLGKPATTPQSWHFTDNFKQYEELSGSHRSVLKNKFLCLYEQPNTDTRQGGYGHIEDFLGGVPVSGLYDIQVHAQAMHRDTHYDPKIFRIDFSEPFQIGVVPGDVTKGHIHYPQAIEPILATAIVPDDAPQWLRFRVWLEVGQTPRFIFPNGPYESRASVIATNKRYKKEFKKPVDGVSRSTLLREGKLPHIRIGEIKIDGPVKETGGGNEELAVFGSDGFQADDAQRQLHAFGQRAYRRPLDEADRARIDAIYQKRLTEKATPRQAALDTLKMILCSPSFLYLSEITPEDESELRPFDLASRLSYALWAAPPDEKLFAAARDQTIDNRRGSLRDPTLEQQSDRALDRRSDRALEQRSDRALEQRSDRALDRRSDPRHSNTLSPLVTKSDRLTKPAELKKQIRRMLADDRSKEFVNGFLDSWLNLRDIGNLPPPRKAAWQYYSENLPEAMKQEARLFFTHLLKQNGSVIDFLDADYTFADKRLAKLYQLPERETLRLADGFQRVSLADNKQRGGVLGMAGVLTVSANGVDTSPVTRGVWVSENILGITPPSPPDEVPALDADVSGATTIREKLAKHSAVKTCVVCHRSIDPLGFALETFDPIGRWRSKYPKVKGKAASVDASGEFPSGQTYKDFASFKTVLMQDRRDEFARNLIEKLLTYTTGRHMERIDQYEIDDILQRVKADNFGLRTMVEEVLTSKIFRCR